MSLRYALFLGVLFLVSTTTPVDAQRNRVPDGFPDFSNPQKMFEQFFGGDSVADDAALERIPVSWREEQQFGKRAADQFIDGLKKQGIEITTRGQEVEYIRSLADTIRPQMRNAARYRTFKIYFADSERTDAFAFPGGHLIFFRGMVDFVQSEAALVGVIGHELSHLDRKHQLRHIRQMKLAQQTFSGQRGFSPDQFFRGSMMMARTFMRPFRPEDESEADEDGATWSFGAGYDPIEMALVFRRMADRDGRRETAAPAFFRTHPYHADRYAAVVNLRRKLTARNPAQPLYIGVENLRRRIPRSEREFPE